MSSITYFIGMAILLASLVLAIAMGQNRITELRKENIKLLEENANLRHLKWSAEMELRKVEDKAAKREAEEEQKWADFRRQLALAMYPTSIGSLGNLAFAINKFVAELRKGGGQ